MRVFARRFLVIAVNLAVMAGLLGLLEFGARMVRARRLGLKGPAPAAYMDRWTGWRNAPGFHRIDIHHDGQGFRRDAEVSLRKAPNTVRIFFLGGSAAYGCEGLFKDLDPEWRRIYNRDLVDVFLEKKLQERHPERRWEVINAAVSEFRMHQHLLLLYARLLIYKPDAVIFMDGHNDIAGLTASTSNPYDAFKDTPHEAEFQNMVYPNSLRSWFFINAAWLRNNSVLFEMLQTKVLAGRQEEAFGGSPDGNRPVPTPVQLSDLDPAWQERAREGLAQAGYYTQMAERLHAALAHEGIPAVFSLQPETFLTSKRLTATEARFAEHFRKISGRYVLYMYEHLRPEISRSMMESARRNGFVFTDLDEAFRNVTEKTFTDYCHLTPRGNELIAERLYQAMAADLIPKLIKATGPAKGADVTSTVLRP